MGAWHDVKALSPRPSEDQLEEVRVLAEQLRVERRTAPRRHYDVELTPDLGFAVFYGDRYRALKHIRHLPGYCEVEGHAECWLSTKLRDFIVSNGLHAHPNVMPAIAEEIDRMEQQVPWGEALEMASSCADPDLYPDKLIPVLRSMNPIGITWDQGRHSATREA